MTEYIEREALKILFAGACAECRDSCAEFDGIEANCNQCLLNGVIKDAKSIPAADVRPVVFCKDCRHRDPEDHKCDCGQFERAGCIFPVDDDYFCAYGERPNCGADMREES